MRLQMPILSQQVVLRTLQPSDASTVYLNWLSNPEINAYLEIRFSIPESLSDLASFIEDANESSHTLLLGIFLRKNNLHVGNIKLGPIDWNHKVADIGFLIGDRDQWGKGLASLAISLIRNYAFERIGLAKLTAGHYAPNEGSHRALLKAGFLEEGRLLSQVAIAGHRTDAILMGCVNPTVSCS